MVHCGAAQFDGGPGSRGAARAVTHERGGFITLPCHPVYAGEDFDVYIYAQTASVTLSSVSVELYFNHALLEYVRYAYTAHLNTPLFTQTLSAQRLSWSSTGRKSPDGVVPGVLVGEAIFLCKVTLRFVSGTAAGTYDSSTLNLYPRVDEFVSTAGTAFVSASSGTQRGKVYHHTAGNAGDSYGSMTVHAVTDRGIFAYSRDPVLLNRALLTGVTSTHSLEGAIVSDDRRLSTPTRAFTPSACSPPADAPFALSGCTIELTTAHVTSVAFTSVTVTHSGHSAVARFGVLSTPSLSLSSSDAVLNRLVDASGSGITSCGGDHGHPYQRARVMVSADVDGQTFDLTALVQMTTDAPSVAQFSSGESWSVVQGRSAGNFTVFLQGRTSTADPKLEMSVSDVPVSVARMVARVVTEASWSPQPLSSYADGAMVAMRVLLRNVMQAEGDWGYLHSLVEYSDGAWQDVATAPVVGYEEVVVSSRTVSVAAYAPNSAAPIDVAAQLPTHEAGNSNPSFWKLGVAVGAGRECTVPQGTVSANWTVCGATVAQADVPLFVDLPNPISASFDIRQRYRSARRTCPLPASAAVGPIACSRAPALRFLVRAAC